MLTTTRRSAWTHHVLNTYQHEDDLHVEARAGSALASEDGIGTQVVDEGAGLSMEYEDDATASSEDSEDSADSDSGDDERMNTNSEDELESPASAQPDYTAESICIDEHCIASIFNMLVASRRIIYDIDMVSDFWVTTDLDLRSVVSRSDVF
jgi:hypothetical protein